MQQMNKDSIIIWSIGPISVKETSTILLNSHILSIEELWEIEKKKIDSCSAFIGGLAINCLQICETVSHQLNYSIAIRFSKIHRFFI